jgi:hypothetical protein
MAFILDEEGRPSIFSGKTNMERQDGWVIILVF